MAKWIAVFENEDIDNIPSHINAEYEGKKLKLYCKDIDELKAKFYSATMDEHFMPTKLLDCDKITDIIDEFLEKTEED